MKDKIILFFKGIILGVSFVIPGVSGGTLAVTMGLYEELIEAISHFYQSKGNFKKYFLFILPIALGIVVSVVLFARIIKFGLDKMPVITIMFFMGLILGGIPSLLKKISNHKYGFKDFIYMFVGILVLLVLSVLSPSDNAVLSLSFVGIIKLLFVGIIASASMVVPGISGSFMLMIMGFYEPIINLINDITSFNNIVHNILLACPFGIGIVLGIVTIAKLIEKCLKKYERQTYCVIIGFVFASLLQIFITIFDYNFTITDIIVGIILMSLSASFIYKFFSQK